MFPSTSQTIQRAPGCGIATDFRTLPPEINSGLMHAGPGAGSIRDAAGVWDRLAVRLYTAAADYRAVTSRLAASCEDPTATTRAATPYIDWLNDTAAEAEHAARQAAAARAHESALAATAPPAAIDSNRARRRSLAIANCLGDASPSIADIDGEYERMWVLSAEAMYTYARASADASVLTPFTSPPPPADRESGAWAVSAAPDVISAGRQLMSAIPAKLRALSSSSTEFSTLPSSVASSLSKLSSLSAPTDSALAHLNSLNKARALNVAAALRSVVVKSGRGAFAATSGGATSVGVLSVPRSRAAETTPGSVTLDPWSDWFYEAIHLVRTGEPPTHPLSR